MTEPVPHLSLLWPRTSRVFLCGVLSFFEPYLSHLENQNQILFYLPHKINLFYLTVKQFGFSGFCNGKETSKISVRPLTAEGRVYRERGILKSWPEHHWDLGELTSSRNLTFPRMLRESWIRWYLRFLPTCRFCAGEKELLWVLSSSKLPWPQVCG